MKLLMAGLALAAMACATTPPDVEPPSGGGEGPCSVQGLTDLIGRPASQALGAEAMQRSGARALRWIRPDQAVTMDYRPDRLNVHLDSADRVEGLDCG